MSAVVSVTMCGNQKEGAKEDGSMKDDCGGQTAGDVVLLNVLTACIVTVPVTIRTSDAAPPMP